MEAAPIKSSMMFNLADLSEDARRWASGEDTMFKPINEPSASDLFAPGAPSEILVCDEGACRYIVVSRGDKATRVAVEAYTLRLPGEVHESVASFPALINRNHNRLMEMVEAANNNRSVPYADELQALIRVLAARLGIETDLEVYFVSRAYTHMIVTYNKAGG